MLKGLPERLEKAIVRLAPARTKTSVVAESERKYGALIGGSIRASLEAFPRAVITHEEYNDIGPGTVHHSCFSRESCWIAFGRGPGGMCNVTEIG
jgi:actin-related protein